MRDQLDDQAQLYQKDELEGVILEVCELEPDRCLDYSPYDVGRIVVKQRR